MTLRALHAAVVLALAVSVLVGCGGGGSVAGSGLAASRPRQTVIWIGAEGLDGGTASRLRAAGVDLVVQRRGTVDLSSEVPVLSLQPAAQVEGPVPVGMALYVHRSREGLDADSASALWRALSASLGDRTPAELLLDLPVVPAGMAEFVSALAAESGVPVVPMLVVADLGSDPARELVAAARSCVVPVYGALGMLRRGAAPSLEPLEEQLAPIMSLDARVRVGIVLEPQTEPDLGRWGEDIGPLTEPATATMASSSTLDRTFVLERELVWSGRSWRRGDQVAVRFMDPPRLAMALAEIHRGVLPEIGGWDLISLPPAGAALGMGRDALLSFLDGDGPAPRLAVEVERSGRTVRVRWRNDSPFGTAIVGGGTWAEVAVAEGLVEVESPGDFDRMRLGTRRGAEWQDGIRGGANSVRLFETYVAPGEEMWSAPVTVASPRIPVTVRWQLTLSSGEVVTGSTRA